MKIGLYDPYLHILGGAERYIASIADCLKSNNHVFLFGATQDSIAAINDKFSISLSPQVIPIPWNNERSEREKKLSDLDGLFYITDGSVFSSKIAKKFLIIQTPAHIPKNSLLNRFKLRDWQIIVYSQFMADIVHKRLGKRSNILFVPIQDASRDIQKKEHMILSVGRFFPNLHNKKQLEMVDMFKRLCDKGLSGYTLYLVGSIDPGGDEYFEEVKKSAHGYPIKIITNASHNELINYYERAKIYWHAAGFGEDLKNYPERAEHFGVSTVEAMSYGVVPLVFAGGGQPEIVQDNASGFLWQNESELSTYTQQILHDENKWKTISSAAIHRSSQYSQKLFCEKLHELLST